MTLFERTKEIASKRGMSLQEVAKKANLGVNSIYRWKERNPTTSNITKVADVLGVSVDYLLGNTDDMHNIKKDDEPIDLYTVSDDERDKMISANGQPISDEDWAIIKAVLARYPKRD